MIRAICTGCLSGMLDLMHENAPCPICTIDGRAGRLRYLAEPVSGTRFRNMQDEDRGNLKLRPMSKMRGAA